MVSRETMTASMTCDRLVIVPAQKMCLWAGSFLHVESLFIPLD